MEKLGIQPVPLLLQTVNFLILMFILGKFLYKPIQRMLEERKKKIEEGLKYTEKAKKELEESNQKREEIIKIAKDEAKNIIAQAKKEGKVVSDDIIKKAHEDAAVILDKAKKDIDLERQDLKKRLEDETVDLAVMMVQKVLEGSLSEKDQKVIIEKKLAALSKGSK